MAEGLYVPDNEGSFTYREAAAPEMQTILAMEHDTGVVKFNINLLCLQQRRLFRDIVIQTQGGMVCGILVLTDPMGPAKIAELEAKGLLPKV